MRKYRRTSKEVAKWLGYSHIMEHNSTGKRTEINSFSTEVERSPGSCYTHTKKTNKNKPGAELCVCDLTISVKKSRRGNMYVLINT